MLPEIRPGAGRTELLDVARLAWIRAVTRFPDHELGASARLALGEIAEAKNNLSAARDHYQTLIQHYPQDKYHLMHGR